MSAEKSSTKKIIGWVLGIGATIAAVIGIKKLLTPKASAFDGGEFGNSGTISLNIQNKTGSMQKLDIFKSPVYINPNLTITGGDISMMSQSVTTQPIKLKKITIIENSKSGQQDVPLSLVYADMSGDMKSSTLNPTQSDMSPRPNMSSVVLGDNTIVNGSAELSTSVMPNARFTLVIDYENA